MPSELLELLVPMLAIFAISYIVKSRSTQAKNGTPVFQANPIPEHWTDPLRPLHRRRMLVTSWGLLFGVAAVAVWQGYSFTPFIIMAAWWLGMVISHTTRTITERSAEVLDERMLAARNRAFHISYYWFGGAMITLIFAAGNFAYMFWDISTITVDRQLLTGATFTAMVVLLYLPSTILAWTETEI